MPSISFKRHRFPADAIRQAVWLYFRFAFSMRDVEKLLAQHGIEVSRQAVRCCVIKFGPLIAANLHRRRSPPSGRWRIDEMFLTIGGRRMFIRRAVNEEGEVLDMLVRKRRNAAVQVSGPSSAFARHPPRRLQLLQHAASPHPPPDASPISGREWLRPQRPDPGAGEAPSAPQPS